MKRTFARGCTLLLAMFYLIFAGGIELLHHHPDGAPSGRRADGVSAATLSPTHDAVGVDGTVAQKTHASDCVACYWSQHGSAIFPSVTTPLISPLAEAALPAFDPSLPPSDSAPPSSRGPPLG